MILLVRHLARVLRDLVAHAVHTRRPGVLLLVLFAMSVGGAALFVKAAGPLLVYPFI